MSNQMMTKPSVGALGSFLDKLKPQLALALPKHMNPDRMTRLALTAFSTTPKLQDCSMKSIAASLMTAGQLGLEPGVNGAGFLVPYGQTCTFVPGWKGLVDLVSRSGRATVYTGVIFKDQTYTWLDGSTRSLVINSETDLEDAKDITHAYAVGMVNGSNVPVIELWRVSKIARHRDTYNKIGKAHYSFKHLEMYARKIVLLQVLKYMPCSIEVSNAIDIVNAAEHGGYAHIDNGIVIDLTEDFYKKTDNQQPAQQQSEAPEKTKKPIEQQINEADSIETLEAIQGALQDRDVIAYTDMIETKMDYLRSTANAG